MSLKDYKQLGLLGRGSYGRVVKALRHNEHLCVLKQVPLVGLSDTELTETVNEAQVMSRISHPNIITYLESFVDDGMLNIAMEYADAGDLAQVIKSYRASHMPEPRIWSYFIQICEGLQYLHAERILHRDLKPSNILLTAQGERALIGDLGFGRLLNTGERWALTGVGTPLYFSPELCEERPYDDKSDVWSLGCLVYEMAALRPPFTAANQVALAEKIVRTQPADIPDTYSLELQFLVTRMLAKAPQDRPSAQQCLMYPAVAVRRELRAAQQREAALQHALAQSEAARARIQAENEALQRRCLQLCTEVDAVQQRFMLEREHQNQLVDDVLREARDQDTRLRTWAEALRVEECRLLGQTQALAEREDPRRGARHTPPPPLLRQSSTATPPPALAPAPVAMSTPPSRPSTAPSQTARSGSPLLSPLSLLLAASPEAVCSPFSPPQSPFHSWDAQPNMPVVKMAGPSITQVQPYKYRVYDDMDSVSPNTNSQDSPETPSPGIRLDTLAAAAAASGLPSVGDTLVLRRRGLHEPPTLDLATPPPPLQHHHLHHHHVDAKRQLEFAGSDAMGPRPSSAGSSKASPPGELLMNRRRLSRKVAKCAVGMA